MGLYIIIGLIVWIALAAVACILVRVGSAYDNDDYDALRAWEQQKDAVRSRNPK